MALSCDGCSCEEFSLNSEDRSMGEVRGVLGRGCCWGGGQRKANVAEGRRPEGKSEIIQSASALCAKTTALIAL